MTDRGDVMDADGRLVATSRAALAAHSPEFGYPQANEENGAFSMTDVSRSDDMTSDGKGADERFLRAIGSLRSNCTISANAEPRVQVRGRGAGEWP